MESSPSYSSYTPLVIERVHLVAKITRNKTRSFRATNLSGYTIHLTTEGSVELKANGIKLTNSKNEIVWYPPNAKSLGKITQSPWTFYTVCFECKNLPEIPASFRSLNAPPEILPLFEQLLELWNRQAILPAGTRDHLHMTSLLYQIISISYPDTPSQEGNEDSPPCSSDHGNNWWHIESQYSQSLQEPRMTLKALAKQHDLSVKKFTSLCRSSTGMPPMKRLKQIRISYARNLLLSSSLTISEVAYHSGYQRVQDFSRDYKSFFGCTPSEGRKNTDTHATEELR